MRTVYKGKTKKGNDILIRYPKMGDLEQLLNFINEISDERTFIRYQGEHETLKSEEKWLKRRLEEINNKKSVQLLAYSGDELIGSTEIHLRDKTEKHVGVLSITVTKNFRGEAVGKTLMGLIIKEALKKLAGLKIITLEVFSTNINAKSLYRKMGFVDYGILPEGIIRNGNFEDAILMYKKI
jgi:ribosomal protein S18 acetylase RimI-like enzyme